MSHLVMSEPPADAKVYHTIEGSFITFGDEYRISLEEFHVLVLYVLCNTNLTGPNDPRLAMLNDIRGIWPIEDTFGRRLSGPSELAKQFARRM